MLVRFMCLFKMFLLPRRYLIGIQKIVRLQKDLLAASQIRTRHVRNLDGPGIILHI